MHHDRADLLALDVWAAVFHMLDAEPDLDGNAAGLVAQRCEDAFRAALVESQASTMAEALFVESMPKSGCPGLFTK